MNRIEEAFPANGRSLFDHEIPIVDNFNSKYGAEVKQLDVEELKQQLAQIKESIKEIKALREEQLQETIDESC